MKQLAVRGFDSEMDTFISRETAATGGKITITRTWTRDCRQCQGSGRSAMMKCGSCEGIGRDEACEHFQVTIPRSVPAGQTLRLRGKGEPSPNGGERGDLLIKVLFYPDHEKRSGATSLPPNQRAALPPAAPRAIPNGDRVSLPGKKKGGFLGWGR